ncbi:NAD(P)-dependent oxidoreductase [Fusibacter bizertensis]|uniref:NAD(P)-dependent oxidoreductase n=1 Tax=Fusibacter bizertensis TaxID=1488331 RepID=A0ABT6NCZ3_9FIRM|nr:NAD(P)-dependent oxidoreductase [Fusibacter bizertensis]MDH8678284.1 NAD(P)-dependent oxidoreductase [Fusibacter bizertensis]
MLQEANKCLLCKNAKCQEGCPINTPIPEVIKLYKSGDIMKAGELLFQNNPLSLICSMVCVHEDQCKGNCILNKKGDPVAFHKIETEISKVYFQENKLLPSNRNKGKVAIIGGGPAGITISFILSQKGYDVTLFEAHSKIGGVLRYGIPEYRLPNDMVDLVEEKLIESGVRIRPNTLIGPVITLDRLFLDGYKAAFIGTGVWNPKPLTIKGETLGNVHYAIDYLKSPETYRLGESVAVIGAGNVALDAARSAIRGGASKVTIVYRKGFSEMPATDQEIKEALDDGISFELYKYPIEIKDDGIFVGLTDSEMDKMSFIHADSTIIAISQTARNNIVRSTTELNTSQMGLLITDRDGRTTKPGTFASGDVVTGAKTVVEAIAHAKVVAGTIDTYCQTLDTCVLEFSDNCDAPECMESVVQNCRENWLVFED